MSLFGYSIKKLESMLHKKHISAEELIQMSLDQIEEEEEEVKAIITLNKEEALEEARALDQAGMQKDAPFFALPIAVKDNLMTKDLRTTSASQFLRNFDHPLYDATTVKKLKHAKAINLGKLNLDEFSMGSSTENSSYQITRNPWNTDYVPGGSSGGSAAAVASGEVLFSLGSDTGGSIRQPASFSGVVGMKPTYGLVSRHGLIALAPSLEQVGPITQNVEDNARVLEVIAGYDRFDSTSTRKEIPSYTEALTGDIKGLKIAVPQEYLGDGVHPEVKESIEYALQMFELLGVRWEKVSMPHSDYAAAAYYVIASAEASSSLARFDGIRYGVRAEEAKNLDELFKLSRSQGFGDEVKRRIIAGTFALSSGNNLEVFQKAQKVRTLIKREFDSIFEHFDVVMGPTTPTPAYKVGTIIEDPLQMYMNDLLTVPVNLAGVPAISLPCGFTEEEGLPLGLQIIGKPFDESTLYRVAHDHEKATNHHKKRPALGGEE